LAGTKIAEGNSDAVAMSADALSTVHRVFVRRTHASVADMVHLFTGGLRIETF
jgi:hypothetical protein